MSYEKSCAPRRTIARRLYPVGSLVVTPTGRTAKVMEHLDDGRLELVYCGGPAGDAVSLSYALVRAAGDLD